MDRNIREYSITILYLLHDVCFDEFLMETEAAAKQRELEYHNSQRVRLEAYKHRLEME